MEAVALAGHSYGGATVTALCSQEPAFKCAVALDPWWSVLFFSAFFVDMGSRCKSVENLVSGVV